MIQATAYARYSTDNQDANSIAYQMDKIRSYCRENDISIVSYYTDEAQSGTNTNRDGFQRLLAAAHRREFDAVVIYDISRGSRDVGDWFAFRKEMMGIGIQVISATQNLGDPSDPNSFLHELISVGLGHHQVLETRKKSIAGVAVKAREGKFLGGYAPIGYSIVDGEYVINPTEASYVRTIFSMYARGDSYGDILKALPQLTGRRGRPIGKNSLHYIIKNESYVGTYSWNQKHVKLFGKWAGGGANPDGTRIENRIPPIIDVETWERAMTRMRNSKQNAANTAKREYLLSGVIECSRCGGVYTGATSINQKKVEYRYYVCGNKKRTRACDAHNLPGNELEAFVVAQVDQYFRGADFDALAQEIARAYNSARPDLAKEKAEILQIDAQIRNGIKAVLSGMSVPELDKEIERLRLRKGELQDLINLASYSKDTIDAGELSSRMRGLKELWGEGRTAEVIRETTKVYSNADGTITVHIGVSTKIGCGGGI